MDCSKPRDKKITVQKLIGQTADAHGQVDRTTDANWGTYCTEWCSCVSKGGREFWKVQQVNADVSHVWTAMWSKTTANITPFMRLIFEGNTYEILSVQDINMDHYEIEIQTKRAV
jgi:hypothetical protein